MEKQPFKRAKKIVDKYHNLLFSLPGLWGVGYNDEEITVYVKPENVESAKHTIGSQLDGIPVSVRPRTQPFAF